MLLYTGLEPTASGAGGHYADGSVGVRFRSTPPLTYACGLTLEVDQSMGAGHKKYSDLKSEAIIITIYLPLRF